MNLRCAKQNIQSPIPLAQVLCTGHTEIAVDGTGNQLFMGGKAYRSCVFWRFLSQEEYNDLVVRYRMAKQPGGAHGKHRPISPLDKRIFELWVNDELHDKEASLALGYGAVGLNPMLNKMARIAKFIYQRKRPKAMPVNKVPTHFMEDVLRRFLLPEDFTSLIRRYHQNKRTHTH